MRRCVRVLCGCAVAAVVSVASIGRGAGQDAPAASISPGENERSATQFLLFSGVDLWRASTALYGGLHWAPAGLNNDGIVVRLLLSRNFERYGDSSNTISRVSALAGIRAARGSFDIKLMAGPQHESNDPTSPDARLRGSRLGLQAIIETWWEPTPELLVASSWSGGTLDSNYAGRLAIGWRVFGPAWIGPEIASASDEFSTQYRIGLHLTGLAVDDLEWSGAVGWLDDSFRRRGFYGRIGVLLRR